MAKTSGKSCDWAKNSVTSFIEAANFCESNEDCVDIEFICPKYINKAFEVSAEEAISDYGAFIAAKNCPVVKAKCAAPDNKKAICFENKCIGK